MRQPYSNRMQHQLPIRSQHHLPWHTYPSFSNKPFRIPPPTNPPTFIPPRWGPWYYDHPTTPPPPSSGVVHHHPQHLHQPHSLTKASKQPCKTISKQNPNRPGINPSLNTKSLNHAKKSYITKKNSKINLKPTLINPRPTLITPKTNPK